MYQEMRKMKVLHALKHNQLQLNDMYDRLHDVMREGPDQMSAPLNELLNEMARLNMLFDEIKQKCST